MTPVPPESKNGQHGTFVTADPHLAQILRPREEAFSATAQKVIFCSTCVGPGGADEVVNRSATASQSGLVRMISYPKARVPQTKWGLVHMKLLHLIATPRGEESGTLRVSRAFLDSLRDLEGDLAVDVIDLYNDELPAVAGDTVQAKYTLMTGQPVGPDQFGSWRQIEALIERFLAADVYLISTPMWNLSIPCVLKYYIDCIVQPGYLFRYDHTGQVVPLVHGKKMICVTSRGGDYSPASPLHAYDFQEPYLRAIFGLTGITDIEFINAQPMDVTADQRQVAISVAVAAAEKLAAELAPVA
jgi:FMN-dependent NADH-azoreductase